MEKKWVISIIILVVIFVVTLLLLPFSKVVGCTKEAKICPDGSSVGRSGEKCEFEECPSSGEVYCEDEERGVGACIEIYQPVCGWNDPEKIQCITYPCASTYSNSCFACRNEGVLYYTEGECPSF